MNSQINTYIATYGRRLYGLCMHLCRNHDDAEDLYQETWLKAIASFANYDTQKPFEPWISCICVNTYKDMYRRRKRSPVFNLFQTTEEKTSVLAGQADPVKRYDDLAEAVGELDENLRVTILLFYYLGLNVKEVAAVLQIPEGTVKSRLNTARKRLREWLRDE